MDVSAYSVVDRRRFDRRLFAAAAVLFSLLVFVGFGRTYYLKSYFAAAPLPSAIVHFHGLLMTAWVLFFSLQVSLVAARRVRLHQRLGYSAIALAVLIVVTGFFTALRAGKYGSASTPPNIAPLAFMLVPMFDLIMFVVFFGAAIRYRRRPADHKGLMLLTALNFLPPALARFPIPALLALGPLWFFGLPALLALVYLVLERRVHGRVTRSFAVGLALLLFSYVFRLTVMTTDAWLAIAGRLVSLV